MWAVVTVVGDNFTAPRDVSRGLNEHIGKSIQAREQEVQRQACAPCLRNSQRLHQWALGGTVGGEWSEGSRARVAWVLVGTQVLLRPWGVLSKRVIQSDLWEDRCGL